MSGGVLGALRGSGGRDWTSDVLQALLDGIPLSRKASVNQLEHLDVNITVWQESRGCLDGFAVANP